MDIYYNQLSEFVSNCELVLVQSTFYTYELGINFNELCALISLFSIGAVMTPGLHYIAASGSNRSSGQKHLMWQYAFGMLCM